MLLRLSKQIPDLRRAHADKHLNKLGAGDGKKRNLRFPGHRFCKQCFSGPRRAHEQGSFRTGRSDIRVLFRIVQIQNQFLQKLLRFFLSRDIFKSNARSRGYVFPGAALSE